MPENVNQVDYSFFNLFRKLMSVRSRIRFSTSQAAPRPSRRTIGIGVIGLGTVGTGTVKVLQAHQHEVDRRVGCRMELKTVCDVQKRDYSWLGPRVRVTTD